MVQGNNKEHIFRILEDRNEYIKIMKYAKEKEDITILEFCVMSNHAHILIYEENIENLSRYMHRVNLIYAKYYNKKYDRIGYVFRDRYKIQPIYSERHLRRCIIYIHNNPVKSKLCKKANEYKYSSCYKNIFYSDTEIERKIKRIFHNQKKEKLYTEEDSDIEESFVLMEDDQTPEQICNDILDEIITKKEITKEELYKNEELLGLVIRKIKNQNNVSYRAMEKTLGINRRKLKKLEEFI